MVASDAQNHARATRDASRAQSRFRRWASRIAPIFLLGGLIGAAAACDSDSDAVPPVELRSEQVRVLIELEPFAIHVLDPSGAEVLATTPGDSDAYGAPAATVDRGGTTPQLLPGYDGWVDADDAWRRATNGTLVDSDDTHATIDLAGPTVDLRLVVRVDGPRVKLTLDGKESASASDAGELNKSSMSFRLPKDEHFFGLGERYASVDHRGLSLYSYAEEGGLGIGEDAPAGPDNPGPNGPSMTYFPVPFFLSSKGYGLHLETTFRSELFLGSEVDSSWRATVASPHLEATIYVNHDPLATLDQYTEDTGRPTLPAPWVFGPRRRVGSESVVDGKAEYRLMREKKIPVTGLDDAVHFLPASSQTGREEKLRAWTSDAHQFGYKVMAYNNPYVATEEPSAAADFAFGKDHGYFVKGPDGEPKVTVFISGKLLAVAAVDLTNPDAFAWFQSLLKRTLDLGYDGWMHDFGEYTARDAVFFDGRRGDEMHNEYPVLSAKAAHDLLEKERPGDYLFFVRSGGSGTQAYVPAVWGGDAEATFDETQGLPSSVRGGLNLSMSGVPYWGSDMTGFKCLTNAPNDKEVFLRWVEFGAISPIMMEQNACSNPTGPKKTKWSLWNDQETIDHYKKYAGLHTRLLPYWLVLRDQAHATGRPLTLHPFLLHPDDPKTFAIDDAYYLGPALFTSPVVRRGVTEKDIYFPGDARYVDLTDYRVHEGGATDTVSAPLGRLPLFLVSEQLLPMLDPSIQTLAGASVRGVISPADVADRLDVIVALGPGKSATLTLSDGTTLTAARGADAGNPNQLTETTAMDLADCASCFLESADGDVSRLRANGEVVSDSEVDVSDLVLRAEGGPPRRIRWDVLRLK